MPAEDDEATQGLLKSVPVADNSGAPVEEFSSLSPQFYTWRDGICNCLANVWPSCCTACFCPGCFAGQMYEKQFRNKGFLGESPCVKICAFFVIVYVVTNVCSGVAVAEGGMKTHVYAGWQQTGTSTAYKLASHTRNIVSSLACLALVLLVFIVRQSIRVKYGIVPDEYFFNACCTRASEKAVVEDAVCACCCTPCTICQMARHVYDYNSEPGGAGCRFSATGDRADQLEAGLHQIPITPKVIEVRHSYG